MAKSVLDIVIKLSKQGGADKETVTGLIKVKSAMMDAAAVAGTVVAAGYAISKAWEQTAGVAVSYANEVRGVTQSTGLQVEEASKLIQVLDDMKISYDDLQKAVAKNGDKFDYSIQGLAKMSDAYKALGTEQERTEFMQERFGKNWVQFVEVMQQGSTKLLQAGNDINKALILDDKALASAREYEQNLDNVNDSVLALKVSMGNELIPVANDLVTHYTNISESLKENGYWYTLLHQFSIDEIADKEAQSVAVDSATTSYTAWAQAVEAAAASAAGLAAAVEVNYSQMISMTQSLSDAQTSYADNVAATNADITLTDEERKIKLGELAAEYESATAKIVGANFLQQLSIDGVTQAEFEMYTEYQVATGAMTEGAAAQALAMNEVTTAAANGTLSVHEMAAAMALLQDKTVTLTVNQVTNMVQADSLATWADMRAGYATGTNGWETVPAGYPNDSFPVGLTSGEKFSVIPAGGGTGSTTGGGGSGGGTSPITVVLNYSSLVSMADKEEIKKMQPYVFDMIREAQAQGVIR